MNFTITFGEILYIIVPIIVFIGSKIVSKIPMKIK